MRPIVVMYNYYYLFISLTNTSAITNGTDCSDGQKLTKKLLAISLTNVFTEVVKLNKNSLVKTVVSLIFK